VSDLEIHTFKCHPDVWKHAQEVAAQRGVSVASRIVAALAEWELDEPEPAVDPRDFPRSEVQWEAFLQERALVHNAPIGEVVRVCAEIGSDLMAYTVAPTLLWWDLQRQVTPIPDRDGVTVPAYLEPVPADERPAVTAVVSDWLSVGGAFHDAERNLRLWVDMHPEWAETEQGADYVFQCRKCKERFEDTPAATVVHARRDGGSTACGGMADHVATIIR